MVEKKLLEKKEIKVDQSIKFLKNKNYNIAFLDVRERKKYVQGFAFGSVNCPKSNFKNLVLDLVPDKKTIILLIGLKNKKERVYILNHLFNLGYKFYFTISKDYKAWLKKKLPFWSGEYTFSKAFGEWTEITSSIKNIYPKDLAHIHKKGGNYLQIDTRPKSEFKRFSIPNSKQCSGGELPVFINNKSNLKKNYILHCAGRTRGIIAYQTLNDFNFKNKKFVLNGGTQNWVLKGYLRKFNNKSSINSTKVDFKKDLKLARRIASKFSLPKSKKKIFKNNSYNFQISSEIKKFSKIKGWKNVNATTLIQNTDKYIASTNTKIYVYSDIPTSSIFAVIWLRRMGYNALWQEKKPNKIKRNFQKTKTDPTYFFPFRHKGSKMHSKGYLNWEHSLIPQIQKWKCNNPWVSSKKNDLSQVEHTVYKVYKNIN